MLGNSIRIQQGTSNLELSFQSVMDAELLAQDEPDTRMHAQLQREISERSVERPVFGHPLNV